MWHSRTFPLAVLVLLSHIASASAQPQFTVDLLQSPAAGGVAYDVNGLGIVVGHTYGNDTSAVAWIQNKVISFGPVTAPSFGHGERPVGINSSGKGFFNSGTSGYLVNPRSTTAIVTEVPNANLAGINDAGLYVGTSNGVATLWDGNSVRQLPSASGAFGVNNVDVVTGFVDSGTATAMRWQSDTDFDAIEILPALPAGGATNGYAINDFNHVVGTSAVNGANHAVAWFDSQATELPALPNSSASRAWDINIEDWVVGESTGNSGNVRATLWIDETPYDLSTLIVGNNPFQRLTVAFGINDRGEIVGSGIVKGVERPFILHPKKTNRSK